MDKVREIIYKAKWRRFHPTAFEKFAAVMADESLSLDELKARQEAAKRRVVQVAMTQTQFYPQFYGAVGFQLGDIGQEGWFERLPIVTKKELREHFDEFVNPALRSFMKVSTTGGSTGMPTKTGYDRRIPEEVYSWRLQSRFGVHPWDDHAYVWRDPRHSLKAKFMNAAMWWPTRHLKLDATVITEGDIQTFLKKCRGVKPTLLQGYVGALTQVAQYVDAHAGILGDWRPKVVWATSAPLARAQRELMERVFGAKVCDQYGSCELRWIAEQCPECKGLHVNVEHVFIEFVDEGGKSVPRGEYGRTLLTNLEDEVFPLIRYENNDRGRWLTERCACGRTLPCIDSVKGRESESFVLPSGKVINGEYLTTIFDAEPELVRGFRVVQHKDASITIEYIPARREDEKRIGEILTGFAGRLGGEVAVDWKRVEEIVHDRGKLRFVVREG